MKVNIVITVVIMSIKKNRNFRFGSYCKNIYINGVKSVIEIPNT